MNPNSNNSKGVKNEQNNDYAQVRISHYAARFAAYDDEQLQATVAHERKVRGWGSERSYFLAALRAECDKRNMAYCW